MTQEELKLVLDALKWCHGGEPCGTAEAITAVEKALAQTQEPVATLFGSLPVYDTTPPQRTEQEPVALPCCGYADSSAIKWNPYSQVVQCHNCGQVYTLPPQRTEPEPVAIPDDVRKVAQAMQKDGYRGPLAWASKVIDFVADYTTPPQRTWVGLTDEEIKAMDVGLTSNASFYAGALWAEAKLKEKNGA